MIFKVFHIYCNEWKNNYINIIIQLINVRYFGDFEFTFAAHLKSKNALKAHWLQSTVVHFRLIGQGKAKGVA